MTNFQKALASFAVMLISLPLVGVANSWWPGVFFPIGLVLGILYLIDANEDRIARNPGRSEILIDSEGVTRPLGKGKLEQIRWDDLEKIEIITTADGPWGEDVFWVLSEAATGCVVANGDAKIHALMDRLQSFPGFNDQAVIDAMGSTSANSFLIWQRQHAS